MDLVPAPQADDSPMDLPTVRPTLDAQRQPEDQPQLDAQRQPEAQAHLYAPPQLDAANSLPYLWPQTATTPSPPSPEIDVVGFSPERVLEGKWRRDNNGYQQPGWRAVTLPQLPPVNLSVPPQQQERVIYAELQWRYEILRWDMWLRANGRQAFMDDQWFASWLAWYHPELPPMQVAPQDLSTPPPVRPVTPPPARPVTPPQARPVTPAPAGLVTPPRPQPVYYQLVPGSQGRVSAWTPPSAYQVRHPGARPYRVPRRQSAMEPPTEEGTSRLTEEGGSRLTEEEYRQQKQQPYKATPMKKRQERKKLDMAPRRLFTEE